MATVHTSNLVSDSGDLTITSNSASLVLEKTVTGTGGNLNIGSESNVATEVRFRRNAASLGFFTTSGGTLSLYIPTAATAMNIGSSDNFGWEIRYHRNAATIGLFSASGGALSLILGSTATLNGNSKVLVLENVTNSAAAAADSIQLHSVDLSAGNTIPVIRTEGTGITGAGITSTTVTHKVAVNVNGTVYYLLATTNGT